MIKIKNSNIISEEEILIWQINDIYIKLFRIFIIDRYIYKIFIYPYFEGNIFILYPCYLHLVPVNIICL